MRVVALRSEGLQLGSAGESEASSRMKLGSGGFSEQELSEQRLKGMNTDWDSFDSEPVMD